MSIPVDLVDFFDLVVFVDLAKPNDIVVLGDSVDPVCYVGLVIVIDIVNLASRVNREELFDFVDLII